LLNKLETVDNLGLSNEWFESYLSERAMSVDVDGTNSPQQPISRGVPQGSVLGPVLFDLYYDDVVENFASNDITLFADDTATISTASNTLSLLEVLQSDLAKINSHLASLRMKLNAKKKHFMLFRNENNTRFKLSVDDRIVDHVLFLNTWDCILIAISAGELMCLNS
jgi:hypothetical protein